MMFIAFVVLCCISLAISQTPLPPDGSCSGPPTFNCNCGSESSTPSPNPLPGRTGKSGPPGPKGAKGDHQGLTGYIDPSELQRLRDDLDNLRRSIPRSCYDLNGKPEQSGYYVISPDPIRVQSFIVYCNFTGPNSIETIISHNSVSELAAGKCGNARCYNYQVVYDVSLAQVVALINVSAQCRQFIKYRCIGSVITHGRNNYAVWLSRDGSPRFYWGGATSRRDMYCACGETGTCIVSTHNCNCDINTSRETSDEGYLTDKDSLPVTGLQFGDTDGRSEFGWHTLGPLICSGQSQ